VGLSKLDHIQKGEVFRVNLQVFSLGEELQLAWGQGLVID
jgi:hypothetical protein